MQLVLEIFILQRYCVISAEDVLRFCKCWVPTVYPNTSCMSISESNVIQTKLIPTHIKIQMNLFDTVNQIYLEKNLCEIIL